MIRISIHYFLLASKQFVRLVDCLHVSGVFHALCCRVALNTVRQNMLQLFEVFGVNFQVPQFPKPRVATHRSRKSILLWH